MQQTNHSSEANPIPIARPSQTGLLWLAAILVLGGFLRLYALDNQSLWGDEVLSVKGVEGLNGGSLFAMSKPDPQPPLFRRWILWPFLHYGTNAVIAVRLPSAITGIAALPLIYLMGLRMFSSEAVGLVASALAAISPFTIYYSQEGRPYSLLIFLTLVIMLFFWEIVASQPKWWHWAGLTLATSLAFYTHQYAALVSVTCGLYLLIRVGIVDARFRAWLLTQTLAAVSCLPWALFTIDMVRSGSGTPVPKERASELMWGPYTFFVYLFGFSLGPTLRELHWHQSATAIKPYLWLLIPMGIAGLWVGVACLRCALRPGRRQAGIFCLTWLLVPVGLALLMTHFTNMTYQVRYVAMSFPPFALLLGVAAVEARRSIPTRIALATLAAGMIVSFANYYTNSRYFKEASREAAAFLSQNVDSADVIATTSMTAIEPLRFYGFEAPHDTYDFAPTLGGNDTDRVLTSLEQLKEGPNRRIWLIEWRPWEGDPQGRLRQWLDRNAVPLLERAFPGIEVREYKLERKVPASTQSAATRDISGTP